MSGGSPSFGRRAALAGLACVLCLVVVASRSGVASGQEDLPPVADPFAGFVPAEGPERPPADGDADGSKTFPTVWCAAVEDEETRGVCWAAYRAGLDYYQTGLAHRTRVFAWQHFSTRVIFVVVLALVGAGIFFAWVQFNRGGPAESSELEISAKGVKITSPVVGLIILTLSLAFFYLYLVYVYPINELF